MYRTIALSALLAVACTPLEIDGAHQAAEAAKPYEDQPTDDNHPTRWPDNTVHYYIATSYTDPTHQTAIESALKEYERVTALKFVKENLPPDPNATYAYIYYSDCTPRLSIEDGQATDADSGAFTWT